MYPQNCTKKDSTIRINGRQPLHDEFNAIQWRILFGSSHTRCASTPPHRSHRARNTLPRVRFPNPLPLFLRFPSTVPPQHPSQLAQPPTAHRRPRFLHPPPSASTPLCHHPWVLTRRRHARPPRARRRRHVGPLAGCRPLHAHDTRTLMRLPVAPSLAVATSPRSGEAPLRHPHRASSPTSHRPSLPISSSSSLNSPTICSVPRPSPSAARSPLPHGPARPVAALPLPC